MATQLPVPITFTLPEGWEPAPPDEVGAPGSAFVALHPGSVDGFTANITINGQYRPDGASLDQIADESVRELERSADLVEVRDRTEVGSAEAPGLTQVLDVTTTVERQPLPLVQCQVYLSMQDENDPSKRAVTELALTCKPSQLEAVLGDFQKFVSTVKPGTGEA